MTIHTMFRSVARRVFRPADALPLALLRIGVAAVLLVKVAVEWAFLPPLYGDAGPLPWSVTDRAVMPGAPTLSTAAALLHHAGISVDVTYAVTAVFALALTALLLGWMTRAAALIACYAHWMLDGSGSLSAYGLDMFAQILLFYCVIAPVGAALSLDAHGEPVAGRLSVANRVYVLLLQAHLCVVYATAGLAKAHGSNWWNGDAIWKALMQPQFHHGVDWSWLPWMPGFALALSLMTLVLETGYPAAAFVPRLRTVWIVSMIGMHVGVGLFLGLRLFGAIMIVFNLAAFAHEIAADVRSWCARRPAKSRSHATPAIAARMRPRTFVAGPTNP
jgi:hypothetical protein